MQEHWAQGSAGLRGARQLKQQGPVGLRPPLFSAVGRRRPGPQALHECRADGPGWDTEGQAVRPLEGVRLLSHGNETGRRDTAEQLCRLPRLLSSRLIPGSAMARTRKGCLVHRSPKAQIRRELRSNPFCAVPLHGASPVREDAVESTTISWSRNTDPRRRNTFQIRRRTCHTTEPSRRL